MKKNSSFSPSLGEWGKPWSHGLLLEEMMYHFRDHLGSFFIDTEVIEFCEAVALEMRNNPDQYVRLNSTQRDPVAPPVIRRTSAEISP